MLIIIIEVEQQYKERYNIVTEEVETESAEDNPAIQVFLNSMKENRDENHNE